MHIAFRILLLLLLVPAAALLAVAAHEFGHAVGGRMARLRLVILTAGPLRVERRPDGRIALGWNRVAAAWGGMVISAPRCVDGLRSRMLAYIAGGPLTSLLFGLAALALFVVLGMDGLEWDRDGIWKAFAASLFTFGAACLAIAVGTAVPYRMQGIASDGRRALLLARTGSESERHAALIALGAWSAAGQPPRDWDTRIVERTLAPGDDGSYDAAMGRYLAYLHALDRECPADARAHVLVLLNEAARVPAIFRPLIFAEAAYFAAAHDGDAAAALSYLKGAGKSPLLDESTRYRSEAAVLLAGDDPARGRALCVKLMQDRGASDFHAEELRRFCTRRGFLNPAGQ